MTNKTRFTIIVTSAITAFFLNGCLFESKHSSDEKMIANFKAHKAEFEQLLEMVRSDKGLLRVDDNWTLPADPQAVGVSKDRIDRYRSIFYEIGVPRGFSARDSRDYLEFIATTKGLSVTGSAKGYAWMVNRPEIVVDNLDNYWSKDGKSFTAYRHIEGNWYLWFDYED